MTAAVAPSCIKDRGAFLYLVCYPEKFPAVLAALVFLHSQVRTSAPVYFSQNHMSLRSQSISVKTTPSITLGIELLFRSIFEYSKYHLLLVFLPPVQLDWTWTDSKEQKEVWRASSFKFQIPLKFPRTCPRTARPFIRNILVERRKSLHPLFYPKKNVIIIIIYVRQQR